jgi:glycosyltransferase involved in cell wall biosynthesis
MLSVCTDESKRKKLAEAAKRRAQDFTWEHMVDQYEQLYQRILHP